MDIDKVDIASLFDKPQRYLVPLFQRSYVWSLDAQWHPLWEDVVSQVERARGRTSAGVEHRHFLGALVLRQVPKTTRRLAAYEVIDGQQRLTTLQVMLAAFRDVVALSDNVYLRETLGRLTVNPRATDDDSEAFKVWPTNADRETFAGVMTAGSRGEVMRLFPSRGRAKSSAPPLLAQAYLFFYDSILAFLTKAPGNGATAIDSELGDELLEVIQRRLLLVEIELDAAEDPQVIFETLNARGEPLLASDLVRNFIFLRARDADRLGEKGIQQLYDQWWLPFEVEPGAKKHKSDVGRFWKDYEKRGRIRRSRLDLFLFQFLAYKTGEEIKIEHLFAEFRAWCEREDIQSTALLRDLRDLSTAFRRILAPEHDTAFGVFASRLHALDVTTLYPVLLYLLNHEGEVEADEFHGMLRDLESYLLRREICGLTKKNYNHTFLQLLRSMQAKPRPSRENLCDYLLRLVGPSVEWPDDNKFKEALIFRPLYVTLGPVKTRMVLSALDLALQTNKQERVHLDGELTIEHVLPQSASEAFWPLVRPAEGSSATVEDAREGRALLVHTLGNLTLLTGPLNSSVSNGPFRTKRSAITAHSRLVLNAYFQRFEADSLWDERAIIDRAAELTKLALQIWARPAVGAAAGNSRSEAWDAVAQ